MFYAQFVLAKKGPLARIWLAAHWDKKLTKAHVFETNIEKSVDGILQPKVKMALRTSGHLLLGVVRIYSRKAKYLLADCNEAFVKIKMAFRPGMVDLPEDIREAAVNTITLPEVFHDFDTPMADFSDVDIQAQFTLNQSRAEEITMREDYNIALVTADDGFGDMGFEDQSELMRATTGMEQNLMLTPSLDKEKLENKMDETVPRVHTDMDIDAPIRDDGFGGNLGHDMIPGGLFEESNLFDDNTIMDGPSLDASKVQDENNALDLPAGPSTAPQDNDGEDVKTEDSDDDGDRFGGPPSVSPPPSSHGGSRPASPVPEMPPPPVPEAVADSSAIAATEEGPEAGQDQTTLLQNEEESFALAPVDASAIRHGWPRAKRKRKLIVDEVKNISGEEMKAQLSDTSDIVNTLDLAPPTKRLMHWKETGGVEKLFALPGRVISARYLNKLYVRNLASLPTQNEDFGMAGDKELENLSLEHVRDDEPGEVVEKRGRGRPAKRKQPDSHDSDEEEKTSGKTRKLRHSNPDIENDAMDSAMDMDMMSPQPSVARSPESSGIMSPTNIPNVSVPSVNETSTVAAPEAPTVNRLSTEKNFDQLVAEHQQTAVPMVVEEEDDDDVEAIPISSVIDDNIMEVDEDDVIPINEPSTPAPPSTEQQDIMAAMLTHHNTSLPPQAAEDEETPLNVTPQNNEEDEQAEDETYEEFEERVVNKRAAVAFKHIRKSLISGDIIFAEMVNGQNRKKVARNFYTMLVLKKLQAVELTQNGCYQPISVARGHLFDKAKI